MEKFRKKRYQRITKRNRANESPRRDERKQKNVNEKNWIERKKRNNAK
jgi:hypothetical protein